MTDEKGLVERVEALESRVSTVQGEVAELSKRPPQRTTGGLTRIMRGLIKTLDAIPFLKGWKTRSLIAVIGAANIGMVDLISKMDEIGVELGGPIVQFIHQNATWVQGGFIALVVLGWLFYQAHKVRDDE